MLAIFIVVGETVIQCMGWRWCEVYSIPSFAHLLAAGGVELFFEVIGVIKIYRRKRLT